MTGAKTLLSTSLSFLLASCAGLSTTSVPDTGFAPGAAVQAAMAAYYQDHAAEYDVGPCNRPYFDAITKVDVIEEDAEHLVLGLRYAFRDRLRDDEDSNNIPPSSRRVCRGFESRQSTLAKDSGVVRVIEMTGPTRGASSSPSNVTLGGRVGVGIGSRFTIGN
ncbi:MAG: hypothetical protein ACR2RF_19740 [Geminicoccaceae bacterium]